MRAQDFVCLNLTLLKQVNSSTVQQCQSLTISLIVYSMENALAYIGSWKKFSWPR